MNADSLAADLVAFSNSSGGVILIGIADDGAAHGLNSADVRRINQLIANAATQHMRSPISPTTESIPVAGKRAVIVLTVPEGLDKPYFDRHGVHVGQDRKRSPPNPIQGRAAALISDERPVSLPTNSPPRLA